MRLFTLKFTKCRYSKQVSIKWYDQIYIQLYHMDDYKDASFVPLRRMEGLVRPNKEQPQNPLELEEKLEKIIDFFESLHNGVYSP